MRVYNVGIIGCGVISRTYAGDIQAFYPGLRVAACADINPNLWRRNLTSPKPARRRICSGTRRSTLC